MADKVRLATRIGREADSRLRVFAALRRERLSDALTVLIEQALPPAGEQAGQFSESEGTAA